MSIETSTNFKKVQCNISKLTVRGHRGHGMEGKTVEVEVMVVMAEGDLTLAEEIEVQLEQKILGTSWRWRLFQIIQY